MRRSFCIRRAALAAGMLLAPAWASASVIRVVTYNIEDDISGFTTPRPGMAAVMSDIGAEHVDGITQAPDIIGLQETTSNSASVAPIVTDLDGDYPSDVYAASTFQATESGGDTADGNGPNAVIFNTNTLQLLGSVGVGNPTGSGDGEYRQVARYEFEPVGGTAAQIFYVYVCHAKSLSSGSQTTDQTYQQEEATIIRNDEATLPSSASVIYMGDWNVNGSGDPSIVEMTSAGQGQAFDPLDPTNVAETWANNSAYKAIFTDSSTSLKYRDDIQYVTQNILNGTGALAYISGSTDPLGNNGVSSSATLSELTTASDHLPVIADYTVVSVPEPVSGALILGAAGFLACGRRRRYDTRRV